MSIAEKFETIADAVYKKGLSDGSGTGDDYRKTFWGVIQNNGNPTNYVYAFYGSTWTDEIYDPQHDFVVQGNANNMYYGAYITDTKKTIDISGSGVKANTGSMFQNSKIKRIAKLKLKEDGSNSLSKCFDGCTQLEEIEIEGKIGKSVSFADSPLIVAIMKNVIKHLQDYSGTSNEFSYSITFSSECKTALEAEGTTSPNGNLWSEYIDDLGWTLL